MEAGGAARRGFDVTNADVGPYVPTLTADWLRDMQDRRHRRLTGTLVFADVTGFTRLTELLAARGQEGAEELAELINRTFTAMLTGAYDHGASLIK